MDWLGLNRSEMEEDITNAEDYSKMDRVGVHLWKVGTTLERVRQQSDESKEKS